MNDENWKKVVEKLVPLASEIRNVLDDNLAKCMWMSRFKVTI